MQVNIDKDPPPATVQFDWSSHSWNSNWVEDAAWGNLSCHVCAFRRVFMISTERTVRIHVSGDQRYTLYLDGRRIGFGPDRGMHANWFYQTHDLDLTTGEHRIVAVVWWTSEEQHLSHLGHCAHKPSFLLHAEGPDSGLLSTGIAGWDVLTLSGFTFTIPESFSYCGVGGRTNLDGRVLVPGYESGTDSAGEWKPAKIGPAAFIRAHLISCGAPLRQLRFSMIPAMVEKIVPTGIVRHAQSLPSLKEIDLVPFAPSNHEDALATLFQKMLDGKSTAVIPANSHVRILVDAQDYVCAWPMLNLSGGRDATVKIDWAESLYTGSGNHVKENRDEVDGKVFVGFGDSFTADGSDGRSFEPCWWEAGRYIRVLITTSAHPLAINSLQLRETHYPHRFESQFNCTDGRWDGLMKISKRVLEMCSHETYVDCPYYEQLMYVGDTRLEVLTTYATTRDDRLPRKAIYLFDESRDQTGLTRSRTPDIEVQVIPPFSLWWVMMVHDFAYWRNDMAFVRDRMMGVRAVLEAFRNNLHEDGLVYGLSGWNFTDWVPAWRPGGIPPDGHKGANATINLQFVWVLRAAAELEDLFGEKELAARNRRRADEINAAVVRHFWVPERSLFAEDRAKTIFAEHAQCMAVLGGSVPVGADIAKSLIESTDLERATIYFAHYLFETFRILHKPEAIYDRLPLWFNLTEQGLRTTVESPEPTRSDCHAWGAHPMFHAYATFAGIRPAAPGFRKVRIEPQPGPLAKLRTSLVHPSGGTVELDIAQDANGTLHGTATVPDGIPAELVLPSQTLSWIGGSLNF